MADMTEDETITLAALTGLLPIHDDKPKHNRWFQQTMFSSENTPETTALDNWCEINTNNIGADTLPELARLWCRFKDIST